MAKTEFARIPKQRNEHMFLTAVRAIEQIPFQCVDQFSGLNLHT